MYTGVRTDKLPASPLLKYYAFDATRRADFSVPIFVLFFTSRGLSLAEVGVLEALFTVVVLVCETPTGCLADRIGRRWSLIVGTLLSALGSLAFVLAHSFITFAAIIGVRAIASTFASGTREAWLYETLEMEGGSDRFAYHAGRATAVGVLVQGGAAVLGGVLYAFDPVVPWLLEGTIAATGALIVWTVPEPDRDGTDAERLRPARALTTVRDALSLRSVGVLVGYTAVLFGIANTLEMYIQPVSTTILGVPPANIGLLYAGFAVLTAVITANAGWLEARVGVRRWFTVAPVLLGIMLVGTAFVPLLALPAFVFARGVSAASRPLFGQYVNDRIDSESRATVLSVAGTVRSLATAPLNMLGGALTGITLLTTGMGALGVVLLVSSMLAIAVWSRSW